MKISVSDFGMADGRMSRLYTMENSRGMKVSVTDYGAALVSVVVPDRDGKPVDCVLGYRDVDGYVNNTGSIGCFIGRNANRIGGAKVVIGGKTYALEKNDGENNLHSGSVRTAHMVFEVADKAGKDIAAVAFSRVLRDMEQGFPGNLDTTVTYSLNEAGELAIDYEAACQEDTVCNMTNHSYFNLSGEGSGEITDEVLTVFADAYTPTGDDLIPTGGLADVAGTPMDFRTPKRVGQDIDADFPAIRQGRGYDVNYALNAAPGKVIPAASLVSPRTGIRMEVLTNLPGIQIYTANGLRTKMPGKCGRPYTSREGICFETQYFPNACNEPRFQSSILPAGQIYAAETIFRFSV